MVPDIANELATRGKYLYTIISGVCYDKLRGIMIQSETHGVLCSKFHSQRVEVQNMSHFFFVHLLNSASPLPYLPMTFTHFKSEASGFIHESTCKQLDVIQCCCDPWIFDKNGRATEPELDDCRCPRHTVSRLQHALLDPVKC